MITENAAAKGQVRSKSSKGYCRTRARPSCFAVFVADLKMIALDLVTLDGCILAHVYKSRYILQEHSLTLCKSIIGTLDY